MKNTERYKVALEAELTEVITELEQVAVHNPQSEHDWVPKTNDMDNVSADTNDVADKTEEWVNRTGEVAALETRYNNIRRALKKIEQGNYGICEISNEQIEEARLDANPAARTCTAHKDKEVSLPL